MQKPLMLRGIDHIYLTVTDYDASVRFYDEVMSALGLHKGDKPIGGEPHAHYFSPTFQLTIRPAHSARPHDPYSAGLHHLCFQTHSRDGVDRCYRILGELGIDATEPAYYPEYNPEYYATFFTDPDGLRLEIVGRTGYRDQIEQNWDDFDVFLNPLNALHQRSGGDT